MGRTRDNTVLHVFGSKGLLDKRQQLAGQNGRQHCPTRLWQ